MKLSKWICEIVVVFVLIAVGLGVWWFVATKEKRTEEAQYERLVRIANRQTVEIAIIRQAAELQKLRAAIQKTQPTLPAPPTEVPPLPEVPDPKDVD